MCNLRLTLAFILLSMGLSAQVTFQRNYGFGNETGNKVLVTQDGYLMVGTLDYGSTSDVLVTKTDFDGNVVWSRSYGGIYSDEAFGIDSTYDGGFILAGYTNSFGGLVPNEFDYILLFKIDSSGNLLWSRIIDVEGVDIAYSVCETYDHGFALTGMATFDLFFVKTDSLGTVEWTHRYGSANPSTEIGRTIIQTRDSGYAILGMSNELTAPDTTAILLIANPSGTFIYSNHYRVTNTSVNDDVTYAYDLIQNGAGDLVIAGGTGGFFQNLFYAYSPYLIRTDSTGSITDAKIYSFNTGDSKAYSIREVSGGNYIMGGTMGNFYPFMLLTDSMLNNIWCYYYGNYNPPQVLNKGYGLRAELSNDSGYVLTGVRTLTAPATFSTLIKTNAAGQSGCNQGIPSFSGNSSNASCATLPGTVFYIPGTNSYMSVTLTDTTISIPDSVMCSTTSVEEIAIDSFRVYPNPVTYKLTIEQQSAELSSSNTFEIVDITGKKLINGIIHSSKNEVNVTQLQKGIYFVYLKNESEIFKACKIIKN